MPKTFCRAYMKAKQGNYLICYNLSSCLIYLFVIGCSLVSIINLEALTGIYSGLGFGLPRATSICLKSLFNYLTIPLTSVSVLQSILYSLEYCSFIVNLEIKVAKFFFFQSCFGYSRSFVFLYLFQNHLVDFYERTCWNFYWNCLKSIDQAGKDWSFNNIDVSNPSTFIQVFFSFSHHVDFSIPSLHIFC